MPTGSHGRRGLTLIELLLALVLAALLAALTGRIASGALATRRYAERAIADVDRQALLFEALAEDFAHLVRDLPGGRPPIVRFGATQPVLELTTMAAAPGEPDSPHVARQPALVRYRALIDEPGSRERTIVREVLDLTDPAAVPSRETLARDIERFEVEVLQRGTWSTASAEAKAAKDRVMAVRIGVQWRTGRGPIVRTFPIWAE